MHTSAVEDHATGAGKVMLVEALLLYHLLGGNVTYSEEDGGGDALGQQRTRCESSLVPGRSVNTLLCGTQGHGGILGTGRCSSTYHASILICCYEV